MFAMPATPAIPAMTAVVRLFNFITTLLINHRAFLLTADLVPLERLCPALVSSEVRQQRTHATTKESLTQSLQTTRSKAAKNRAATATSDPVQAGVARMLHRDARQLERWRLQPGTDQWAAAGLVAGLTDRSGR